MKRGIIRKHHSLLHADRILREVRKLWPEEWDGSLRCWANGREQGYNLTAMILDDDRYGTAECVFSEGRSCDGALVMVGSGESGAFDFQTNQPSEATWEGRKYFYDVDNFGDTYTKDMKGRGDKKAAVYIVSRLRAELTKAVRRNRKEKKERDAAKLKASA